MMDHPNLAKVLDAGTTNTGRPFFVMELVKGLPITQYCDGQHLSPRERLELFVPICQAVQYAHQKGIIHRDLKPSYIFIARYVDKPVPKVIDFGVAKASSQKLTEKAYASPGIHAFKRDCVSRPRERKRHQIDVAQGFQGRFHVRCGRCLTRIAFVNCRVIDTSNGLVDNHHPLRRRLLLVSTATLGMREPCGFFLSFAMESFFSRNRLIPWGIALLLLIAGYSLYRLYRNSVSPPSVYSPEYKPSLGRLKDRGPAS